MNFMRLISQGAEHAYVNMALDEAISEAVRQKLSPPTLRLYCWDRPSLSLGCFQKIADIDMAYCDKKGYPVVRRQTGGRAILHDAELTYSISASSDSPLFGGSLRENYSLKAESSKSRERNINHKNPACFRAVSFGEITMEGKKVIGSAQKRYKDGFLQQGSILLSVDAPELSYVLRLNDEETLQDIGALSDHVPDISFSDLRRTLKEAFEKTFNVKLITDGPTACERNRAKELSRNKYSTPEWNFSR
jgi:lipoate-protein ligase A